jgi:hypothetical protein
MTAPEKQGGDVERVKRKRMGRPRAALIYGIGTNDADYVTTKMVNGKQVICSFYRVWASMLSRCEVGGLYQARKPTYVGTQVCEEWRSFLTFKAWMQTQKWEGKQLDSDFLSPSGQKIYSPQTCHFVSQRVNSLMIDCGAARGKLPIGVSQHHSGRFEAKCKAGNGKQRYIGLFKTPDEAHIAWRKAKAKVVLSVASTLTDPYDVPLVAALHRIADDLMRGVPEIKNVEHEVEKVDDLPSRRHRPQVQLNLDLEGRLAA